MKYSLTIKPEFNIIFLPMTNISLATGYTHITKTRCQVLVITPSMHVAAYMIPGEGHLVRFDSKQRHSHTSNSDQASYHTSAYRDIGIEQQSHKVCVPLQAQMWCHAWSQRQVLGWALSHAITIVCSISVNWQHADLNERSICNKNFSLLTGVHGVHLSLVLITDQKVCYHLWCPM